MKKQTTLFLGTGLSAAPPDQDFVFDGLAGALSLQVFDFTGTNLQVTATALSENGFDLPFAGQVANFAVGNKVRGVRSNATGIVMDQVDNGATGTLALKRVQGTFYEGEDLVRDDQRAVVRGQADGQLQRRFLENGVWADTGVVTASQHAEFLNPVLGAGDGNRIYIFPRRFRLKFTFNGVSNASIAVDLMQSEVK